MTIINATGNPKIKANGVSPGCPSNDISRKYESPKMDMKMSGISHQSLRRIFPNVYPLFPSFSTKDRERTNTAVNKRGRSSAKINLMKYACALTL